MKILRFLLWVVALFPVAAAGYWASFGARLPEPVHDRLALGEVPACWSFDALLDVGAMPLHVVPRALELAALHVPGATFASVVWLDVLIAVALVVLLTSVARRSFAVADAGAPLTFAVLGLLVLSPSLGVNWLHAERCGAWLAPALFALALWWLSGERGFVLRWCGALLAASAAPFCHAHGVLVAPALVPAVLGAARRVDRRGAVWAIPLLVAGLAASGYVHWHTPSFGVAGSQWFGALGATPFAALASLLRATGGTWPDVFPGALVDELVLGAVTWLVPAVFCCVGDRSREASRVAAPFWSCLWFGLGVVVLAALRYELSPPVGTLAEATLGGFLVPIAVVGVLAARCGHGLLAFGAGAVAVLALQGTKQGLEDLRLAVLRCERVEARLSRPDPSRDEVVHAVVGEDVGTLATFVERGWSPSLDAIAPEAALAALGAEAADGLGTLLGGEAKLARGEARCSLRHPVAHWVQLVVQDGAEPPRAVGFVWVEPRGSRTVSWQIALEQPLPEAAIVRAVGFTPRDRRFVALGPSMVVRDGRLVARAP